MPNPKTYKVYIKGNKGFYALSIVDSEGINLHHPCVTETPNQNDSQEVAELTAILKSLEWLDTASKLNQTNIFIFSNIENISNLVEGRGKPNITRELHEAYKTKVKELKFFNKLNECKVRFMPKTDNLIFEELSKEIGAYKKEKSSKKRP
jgi:ribonuclease HI